MSLPQFPWLLSRRLAGALAVGGLALAAAGCASEGPAQAALMAQAKITRQQAQQLALSHAPGSILKADELENSTGQLIWWFDLVAPGSGRLTSVSVDAITGGVISVSTETGE